MDPSKISGDKRRRRDARPRYGPRFGKRIKIGGRPRGHGFRLRDGLYRGNRQNGSHLHAGTPIALILRLPGRFVMVIFVIMRAASMGLRRSRSPVR